MQCYLCNKRWLVIWRRDDVVRKEGSDQGGTEHVLEVGQDQLEDHVGIPVLSICVFEHGLGS